MIKKPEKIIINLPSIILNLDQLKEIEGILKLKNFKLFSIEKKYKKFDKLDDLDGCNDNFITDFIFKFTNNNEQTIQIKIHSENAYISFPENLETNTINYLRNIYYILIKKKSIINPIKLRRYVFIFSISVIIILSLLNHYLEFLDGKLLTDISTNILVFWGFNFFLGTFTKYSKIQLRTNKLIKILYYKIIYIIFLLSNLFIVLSYFIISKLNTSDVFLNFN